MTTLQVLLLALIQGITEFLPISSSAHLILAHRLLGWADPGVVFDVAVHVGSLLAVMVYFRSDLAAMVAGRGPTRFGNIPPRTLLLWLVLATVPLGLAGLFGAGWIEANLRSVVVIAWASIGFGLLLWAADAWARKQRHRPLGPRPVAAMGLAQVLALMPGTSRSGITITAGLLMGLDRQQATRFAFLMAIPAIGAAGVYSAAAMLAERPLPWDTFLLAVVASFIGAWLCIGAFLRLVDRIGFLPFVVYRVALGVFLLV